MKPLRVLLLAGTIVALAAASVHAGESRGAQDGADTSAALPGDGVPACGVAVPAGGAVQPDDDGLHVATFNLLHSQTSEGDETLEERVPLLADAIVSAGVDVVGAQEVAVDDHDKSEPRPRFEMVTALAEELAARTGTAWEWCWAQSNPVMPGEPDVHEGGGGPVSDEMAKQSGQPGEFREGLAVLSQYDITATRFRRLPRRAYEAPACVLNGLPGDADAVQGQLFGCTLPAAVESRQVLWSRIDVPGDDGDDLDLFTTHLAHGLTPLSDQSKTMQLEVALGIVDEWSTADASVPDFLVGDFNSSPGTDADRYRRVLDAGFVDTYIGAPAARECTAPGVGGCTGGPLDGAQVYSAGNSRSMRARIDYVFARPPDGCALRTQWSDVIGDHPTKLSDGRWLWPSDHNGVVSRSKIRC